MEPKLVGDAAKQVSTSESDGKVQASCSANRKHATPSTNSAAAAAVRRPPAKKRKLISKTQKEKRVGNFKSYYSYRLGSKASSVDHDHTNHQQDAQDPRLQVLSKEWFEGKKGLDIGCNSGDMTLSIAKAFGPKEILGIEIDGKLVAIARNRLRQLIQQETIQQSFSRVCKKQKPAPPSTTNDSNSTNGVTVEANANGHSQAREEIEQDSLSIAKGEPRNDEGSKSPNKSTSAIEELLVVSTSSKDDPKEQQQDGRECQPEQEGMPLSFSFWELPVDLSVRNTAGKQFPWNIVFKCEDFIKKPASENEREQYDFITCLSVTKWIHLYHGDQGLRLLFQKIYDLLKPDGGKLILEPQPWKSYHKRKFTCQTTIDNYNNNIKIRPKDFPTFLCEQIGFRKCEFLQVCKTVSNGFRRPVYLVEK